MKYHPLSSEEAEEVVELEVVDAVALVTSKTMQTKCFSSMDGRVGNDRVIRVILLVVE